MEPEKKLTPAQRYYQNHKEARKAYGREYYEKNREKILEANKKKQQFKPEIISPVVPSPLDNFRGRGIVVKKGYDLITQNIMVSFS